MPTPPRYERLIEVSEFSRSEYGISAATATAMLHYGYALMTIAGADGKVSPAELKWLVTHQRKFGAPEEVTAKYAGFDYKSADLRTLIHDIVTDVKTWNAAPNLIYHAIEMCSADGTYAAKEQKKVQEAAKILKVPGDVVLTIQALVEMEAAATKMRRALFHVDTL
jgi:uncharacterized tellurite resistance protein B-like protein